MKFKISILFLVLFSSVCLGQNKIVLELDNALVNKKNKVILLNCKILNHDTIPIVLYKFQEFDFCDGLAGLRITEYKSIPEKKGFYYPCTASIQLDNVFLNESSTFELKGNSQYEFSIKIKCLNFPFRIKKNKCYKLQLLLNYNNIVSSDKIPFYDKGLTSNEIMVCNLK